MADWTNIPNESLEPDAPARSIDVMALRDNPMAIAEGAAGAPRVKTAAMQPPSASNAFIIMRLQEATVGTVAASYLNPGLNNRAEAGRHVGLTVLVPGTVRLQVEHRSTDAGVTANVRVLKNGLQVIEWGDASGSFQARSVDVPVTTGDSLVFQQRMGADSVHIAQWRALRVYSATPDMAVA